MFNHPNIVELKEVYQTTGEKICIIMEYAEGNLYFMQEAIFSSFYKNKMASF